MTLTQLVSMDVGARSVGELTPRRGLAAGVFLQTGLSCDLLRLDLFALEASLAYLLYLELMLEAGDFLIRCASEAMLSLAGSRSAELCMRTVY